MSSLTGAQAATAFNDPAAWQAAHPTHRLLNFDGVATGPLGNQFVGEPGGPSFAPGGVASVISIYNGVGTLSDIQTTGVNAISGPNVIGPDAGLNGSIFVSFPAPISAIASTSMMPKAGRRASGSTV